MSPSITFIRDFAISVAVGMILLLSLSRLIERVQFSLSTAFWCSLIGDVLLGIIAFLIGFAFAWQPAIGAIIAFIIGCVFLSALFQIEVAAYRNL